MAYTNEATDLLLENIYPKLVRDKIPELIIGQGRKAAIRVLSDDAEYLDFLLKKLLEEVTELAQAKSEENQQEELADVFEVLEALIDLKKLQKTDIAKLQEQKRRKRGGFKERLVLLSKP